MVLYYCPTSRRWFCHSPTHHMVTYEKLADRDIKVHQIWKLTFEVIEIKMQFQKRFQPIVSAEQWEWQLGHKFDACILVLLHSFLRVNPNWHEGWYFYLLVIFGSNFASWIFIKNFQTFLEVKIEIN